MDAAQVHRCGAREEANGSVCWRIWAPRAERVELVIMDGDRRRAAVMRREERGYYGRDDHDH